MTAVLRLVNGEPRWTVTAMASSQPRFLRAARLDTTDPRRNDDRKLHVAYIASPCGHRVWRMNRRLAKTYCEHCAFAELGDRATGADGEAR